MTTQDSLTELDLREQLALEQELEDRLTRLSLKHFTKSIWHIIEPGKAFVDNWHIDAICEHLEAVTSFQLENLLINMPPRMLKSILVSVAWPAWVWLKHPERRYIFASYAQSLSTRDAVKMRLVIESPYYRSLIKGAWALKDDQNQKTRFDNTEQGFRLSTSVGGMLTGEGGDYLCIDDPHQALEVHSEKLRQEVLDWYDLVFSTRANDPKRVGRVLVMQRLHSKDLSGHLLEKGGWVHLVLPMHYSRTIVSKSPIPSRDPRTKEGEYLFPERFGKKEVAKLKKDLGQNASAQLDQHPVPDSGGTFKREWWKWYDPLNPPKDKVKLVQFVDCAQKPGISNDYSVVATWLETLTGYYILEVKRGKFAAPDLNSFVVNQAAKWKPHEIVIEDASAGSSLIQYLQRYTKLPVTGYKPLINKELRAIAATPTVSSGNVYLPKGVEWVEDFIEEHELFPNVDNDDRVDTTSMAVDHFTNKVIARPRMTNL